MNLATQVGQPYDARTVEEDLRYLWSFGRFHDIRVESETRAEGIALTFLATPSPNILLHEIRLEPNTFGLQIQLPELTPITPLRAYEIAMDAQKQLNTSGYTNARVTYRLAPAARHEVDLKLAIDPGSSVRVNRILFEGDSAMRGRMKALRIHRILLWRLLPAYSREGVDSDSGRLQQAYISRGYFDAAVWNRVETRGKDATVTMVIQPGRRYPLDPGLCASLFTERREAQRSGVIDFSPKLDLAGALTVDRGPAYRVGRVEFTGNHYHSDSAIRRNLLLEEGAAFDSHLLHVSIARLNRTGWFQPIHSKDIFVRPDDRTGTADITLRLTERKFGSWKLSGPVGPLSLEGPVQASINARLPKWASYTASVSLFAFGKPLLPISNPPKGLTPILALQRAYTPGEGWKSGFAIAPALGWQLNLAGYAATQLQERLLPAFTGERRIETPLAIDVTRPQGEVKMFCELPRPHLGLFRTTATVALHFLGTVSSF